MSTPPLPTPVQPPVPDREATPLAGLRVIELHAIGPVPFAGQLLRGLGAEVTRVSPPQDPGLGIDAPAAFDVLNLGKQRLALDLKSEAGRAALDTRLAEADVLLEGFRPGVLERLGFAPQALASRHPRLVVGRLSGWGAAGPLAPRAGHDINYLALTGVLAAVGDADQPVPPLNLVADFGGGAMHLVVGVLARLVARGIDGRGGCVTTSIAGGTVGLTGMFHGLLAAGVWHVDRAANLLDGGAPFYRTYRCGDGRFVAVGALEPKFFAELLAVTGLGDAFDAARQYDRAAWPELAQRLTTRFAQADRDTWAARAADRDCCLTPVLDWHEASRHPQALANRWYADAPFMQPATVIAFEQAATPAPS